MLQIKGGSLEQLAKAIEQTGIVPEREWPFLVQNLRNLVFGRERFGEVDLANAQQVALVAYRVVGGVRAWPQRARKSVNHYPLVIVGAGSTAAYYLDTLGPAHNKGGTLVIGGENPWIRQRGHAIPFINHTHRQIALPSQNVTTYGGNESFVNRRSFGNQMTNRVRQLAGRVVGDSVTRISRARFHSRDVLRLECKKTGPFLAERVVFVAGSGKEREPDEEQMPENNGARVIPMNTFIRDIAWRRQKGSVVIWGSNAAIDAVAAAQRWGWNIKAWLMSGDPSWLPGTRYKSRPYRLQDSQIVKYENSKNLRIEDDGNQLKVSELGRKDGDKLFATKVDYVVYGISSLDLLQEVLDEGVLGKDKLVPILDTQGVFSDPSKLSTVHKDDPNKAFLGWGTPDHQLQVFGLAAENYEYDTSGPRAKRIALGDPRVMALKQWLSGDVLTVGQLAYIRSALRAVNNFVPGSIEHRVDFSHSDSNQLRVHLATKYPNIPEVMARWFIGMLREVRFTGKPEAVPPNKITMERLPHGFTPKQVQVIEKYLKELDVLGQRHRVAIERLDELAKDRHKEDDPRSHEHRLGELTRLNPRFRAIRVALRRELVATAPKLGAEVSRALAKIPRSQR